MTSASPVADVRPSRDTLDDARHCAHIVRRHARTFALASSFLPAEKKRAAFALYAFCRVADDMVDRAIVSCDQTIGRQLETYHAALDAALAGAPSGPVFRELAWSVRTFGVPPAVMHELIAGVTRDLSPVRYPTWDDLAVYCEGVASTVGEMCTFVFGVPAGSEARMRALRYARTLGLAMQLTNILRDVGEDARLGRCYLPDEDLAMFGLSRDDVLHDPDLASDERWRPFMAFEIGRARVVSGRRPRHLVAGARCAALCLRVCVGLCLDPERHREAGVRHHQPPGRRARVEEGVPGAAGDARWQTDRARRCDRRRPRHRVGTRASRAAGREDQAGLSPCPLL